MYNTAFFLSPASLACMTREMAKHTVTVDPPKRFDVDTFSQLARAHSNNIIQCYYFLFSSTTCRMLKIDPPREIFVKHAFAYAFVCMRSKSLYTRKRHSCFYSLIATEIFEKKLVHQNDQNDVRLGNFYD